MAAKEEVEAELARAWNPKNLAAYGEYLRAQGDPRGELIALELQQDALGYDRERRRRWHAVVVEWLGQELADRLRPRATVELGFIDLAIFPEDLPLLADVLTSPVGLYLRDLSLHGDSPFTRSAIAMLTCRPQVWLRQLSIMHYTNTDEDEVADDEETVVDTDETVVDRELASALIAMTPRLDTLEVDGVHVFGELAHPSIRTLCVTGCNAMGAMAGPGPSMPAVTALDFAFRHSWADGRPDPDAGEVAALLPPGRFPMLRHLDLSRNEAGREPPHYLGGDIDVFKFLRSLAIATQLEGLTIPSLRSSENVTALTARLSQMPNLKQLVIKRSYRGFPAVVAHHLSATITVASHWPWPPPDLVSILDALAIRVPGQVRPEEISVVRAVEEMEEHFDALSESARSAWTELWTFLADLGWDDPDGNSINRPFPASTLRQAMEGLGRERDRYWRRLLQRLSDSGAVSHVMVRRVIAGTTDRVYPSASDEKRT